MRHKKDDRVHWSDLHQMRRSPAHYRYSCEHPKTPTTEMLTGAVFDALVLGVRKVIVYPGKVRNGKEWEEFRAHYGTTHIICIRSEYERAQGAAEAVLSDPVAWPIIERGQKQIVMRWTLNGVPCASGIYGERGGFDLLDDVDGGSISDLKLTSITEPGALNRHLVSMGWHEQLAFYKTGALANYPDMSFRTLRNICVEAAAPHVVTVMRLTPALEEMGAAAVRSYLEKYAACEASGHWPGYVQSEVTADVPAWLMAEEEE
jgi:hypothetical protein